MQLYDISKPSSYLMYYDVNNLYGWAMCQPLPYADFRWVDDVANFNVMDIKLNFPTGYILEIDLEYPQYLHDDQADLPFQRAISSSQLYIKSVIHFRNLQQWIRHGLTKIYRAILQFAQYSWFRDYIDLIQNLKHARIKISKKIYIN